MKKVVILAVVVAGSAFAQGIKGDFDPCNFFPWMPQCMTCPTSPDAGPMPQGQFIADKSVKKEA